jgi:hypothetical protein
MIANEYTQTSDKQTELFSENYGISPSAIIVKNRNIHSENMLNMHNRLLKLLHGIKNSTYNCIYSLHNIIDPDLSVIVVSKKNLIEIRFDTFGSILGSWKHIVICIPVNKYIENIYSNAFNFNINSEWNLEGFTYKIEIILGNICLVVRKSQLSQYLIIRNKKIIFINQLGYEFIYDVYDDEYIDYLEIDINKLARWFELSYKFSGILQFCPFIHNLKCNFTNTTKEISLNTPGKQIFYAILFDKPIFCTNRRRTSLCGL